MTTIAVVHPTNHLAEALREALERRPRRWDEMVLLSTEEGEVGVLTEVRGAAAIVRRYEKGALDGVDVAFFCGTAAADESVLDDLPAGSRAVVLARDRGPAPGVAVVDQVNLERAAGEQVALSPHPAVVQLAHLLHPLRELGVGRVAATVLEPVSRLLGTPLDDLLGQVRSLLSFQPVAESETFPRQVAFNLFPVSADSGALPLQIATLLALDEPPALQIVQAGVFHSQCVALFVDLAAAPSSDELEAALAEHPPNRLVPDGEETAGAIDGAATEEVLVSAVRSLGGGRFALWSVMDNLTRGGALNAAAIFEAM